MHGAHPLNSGGGFTEAPEIATGPHGPVPNAGRTAGKPEHIVHVITRLLQGGAEENTVSTCLYQAQQGARVTLVHGAQPHPSWSTRLQGRIDLVEVPSINQAINPVQDAKAIRDLGRLFAKLRPDVVHTHQSKAGILGRLGAALARVPLVVHTVHIAPFVNVSGPRRWLYLTAERICQRYTDLFISVSEGMRDAFLGEAIGRTKAFEVVHSGMPLAKFTAAAPPANWRSRIGGWQGTERPKFMLMLAAFEPRKRHYQFLKAIAPRLRGQAGICLLLAGEGSDQARCSELVHQLGLTEQIRFLGHDRRPEELVALADICLLTSEREGLPRSAVQYIAGGKPVVLTQLPGIEELIVDGVNGIVTDPDNLDDTVSRAMELLTDETMLARLASGARATDVSRWREEAMGARIAAAYRRVLAPPDRDAIQAIEFFGLPGGGKSTLARHVVRLLKEDGRRVRFSADVMGDKLGLARRSARRLALIAATLPAYPQISSQSIRWLEIGRGSVRDVLKSLWNFTSVLAMMLNHRRHRGEILVSDQGLVQAVWSARMHGTGTGHRNVAKLLRRSRCLEQTLYVDVRAPIAVAQARIQSRRTRTSRMQDPGRIEQAMLWERGERVASGLARDIEQGLGQQSLRSHLIRIRSSSETDPEEGARAIVAHLRELEECREVGR